MKNGDYIMLQYPSNRAVKDTQYWCGIGKLITNGIDDDISLVYCYNMKSVGGFHTSDFRPATSLEILEAKLLGII